MKTITRNHLLTLCCVSMALFFTNCIKTKHIDELRQIDVNGVNIVYQVKGNSNAKPVILLHGNGGEHDHLSVMVNQLDSAGYLVYALDSRGQGANAPLNEYHYTDMAEDVFAFIREKGFNYKLVGDWKVYGDGKAALRTFRSYERCRKRLLSQAAAGASIVSLLPKKTACKAI